MATRADPGGLGTGPIETDTGETGAIEPGPLEPSPSAPARDPREVERELRNAFANADEPTDAALRLVAFLVAGERHHDALAVVDAALERSRTTPLRIARAGLLRDVARPDLAARALEELVRELGHAGLAPGTLSDLAQVQWVAGRRDAAAETLRSLRRVHADDPWLDEFSADVEALHERLERPDGAIDPLANGTLRDLFALLRAAPRVTARMRLLDRLAGPRAAGGPERASVRARAVAIACADSSAAVRARAVQLAPASGLSSREFWRAALRDPSPLVRRFAASTAAVAMGRDVAPVLCDAIEGELDPQVFTALHDGLQKCLSVRVPACDAEDAVAREATAKAWRARCDG